MFRKAGKPDLFITVTCNPNWPEIRENIGSLSPADRPDMVARVFHLKLKALMRDITTNQVFGRHTAFCYTIEFQKRGLPHAHILLNLSLEDKIKRQELDDVICAEIPDPETDPELYAAVAAHIVISLGQ